METAPTPKIEIKPEFTEFIPREFIDNPIEYFEQEGRNIKKGEIIRDEGGVIHEDPTAVKDLPTWKNEAGIEIQIVGKRVNADKGAVRDSGDPFHEYKILEQLAEIGLPAAKPIAKVEQAGVHIIVMERLPGFRWSERKSLDLREKGYTDKNIEILIAEAENKMQELKSKFDEAGIVRDWKLKDMVFQIDVEGKKIISVVPTDWERTRIGV